MVAVSASGPKTSSSADLVQSGIQPDSVLGSLDESLLISPESLSEGLLFSYALRSTPASGVIDESQKLGLLYMLSEQAVQRKGACAASSPNSLVLAVSGD